MRAFAKRERLGERGERGASNERLSSSPFHSSLSSYSAMSSTSASSDDSSVSSPGLKVPATALPTAFWHGGAGRNDEPYTVHDIKMSVLSYAIRCKEDWKCKLADPVIRGKWREEALKVEPLDLEGEGEYQRALKTDRKRYEGLTEEMVDWVFAELDWLAKDDSSVINVRLLMRLWGSY